MTDLIVLALATWRIASLLAIEDGPGQAFAKFRRDAGVRYDDYSQPYGTTELAKGILCIWCVSVWIAFFWAFLYWICPGVAFWLALPFALSAGAILVEAFSGGEGAE